MRDAIVKRLSEIAEEKDVQILLAVESGSRAWGFDSMNSDYDVRFIYLSNDRQYLDIQDRRDVIEVMEGDLDFSGWDLKKTFNLFRKSNPPLLEWIDSPIMYMKDKVFVSQMQYMKEVYWSPRRSIYHYLNLAKGNYRSYIENRNEVKHKKYLYVLRALLCCYWIEKHDNFPPMEFQKVLDFFAEDYKIEAQEISFLVEAKKKGEELGIGEANWYLSGLCKTLLDRYEKIASNTRDGEDPTEALNTMFRNYFYERCKRV